MKYSAIKEQTIKNPSFWLIFILIIVIVGCLTIPLTMTFPTQKEHFGNLYKVWIKTNPKHKNLNFEDWNELRRYKLLPNSGVKK